MAVEDGGDGAADGPADPDAPAPGGLVVRVFAHGTAWPRLLPPAPHGTSISVTVSDVRLLEVSDGVLERRGYRIAGVVAVLQPPGAGDVVDVLVTPALRREHPGWLEALRGDAGRVFDLRFGPVRRLLAPALDLHARRS